MDGRKFTILGETGSGKTCYLLGMYYEMSMTPVSLGDTLQGDSYQGELEPLNVYLTILMGINFALIDQLHYGKWLIEEQRKRVDNLREWKRYEDLLPPPTIAAYESTPEYESISA